MTDQLNGSELAIVGMACRFPGANDLETYWENLRNGIESIAQLTDAELLAAGITPAEFNDPNYVKAAPVIDNIDRFDAAFFGYSSVEAELIDPQQRVLLECAWEALEHAGYNPDMYKEPVGVYAGAKTNTYLFHLAANRDYLQSVDFFQVILGGDLALLSTRLSYKFDLKGPSYAVQTACSTSLVALHLACQSLLIGECRMALAGTVAINVPHQVGYMYRPGDILSPDGRCRPFDAKAEGTLFGSGAGVVVLKRLEDALADGDTIYAVIKGSATNNDGSVKATFTAPSIDGQANVIIEALACSGVDADTISYVEAHGTGTALGDPIEILALTEAFRASTERNGFCAIGSVKSNLGHLDAAAGMSGLIKTVLALQHRQIPPSLHYESPNPQIDFAGSPFYVNTKLADWTRNGHPRRAGVSSFGFGGTNAHVILEEAPILPATDAGRPWQVLLLSARTETALEQASANLAAYLRRNPAANLADVAYTLQVGRKVFDHRRTVICRNHTDALAALEANDHQSVFTGKTETPDRQVVFLFPGQGAQYAQMARDLYQDEPIFREQLDRCAELLRPHLGLDIRDILYPSDDKVTRRQGDKVIASEETVTVSPGHPVTVSGELGQTQYAQPALFVIEYALAQLWMAWGVRPQAMIGHSIGEYVAACLAGVFSLEDALKLVAERGRLMQSLPEGAMLSVSLPEAELQTYLGAELSLAAVNGPAQCVVAGPHAAIEALEQRLSAQEVKCRRLHTSHAFHSAMMEPIMEQFAAAVGRVERRAPQLPYVSNVSGSWITPEEATDPHYWARHLRQPVRFAEGLAAVTQGGTPLLLEVGPGTTLGTLARRQVRESPIAASVCHPDDQRADTAFMLAALSRLWLAGVAIDWPKLHDQEQRRRVPLPTYPFERQRYWLLPDLPVSSSASARIGQAPLSKRPDIGDWFYLPVWRQTALPANAVMPAGAPPHWLILSDSAGIGARLRKRLEQDGAVVTTVLAGASFQSEADGEYTIDPGRPEAYDRLLVELRAAGKLPQRIVHLWSTGEATPGDQSARFDEAQARGFYSLLFLAQALARHSITHPISIGVVTDRVQAVLDGDPLRPERATILGACRVIPQEQPNLSFRSIDIPAWEAGAAAPDTYSDLLFAELMTRSNATTVAYRGNQRWVLSFAPAPVAAPSAGQPALRQNGVYLITGGLGGIGLALATHLAETLQARLVLTGRSALPDRAAWEEWLAGHPEDDRVSRKLRAVQRLEALGAEVLVLSADVTDRAAMRSVVARAEARFGTIHGFIHAAGMARGEAFRSIHETGTTESGWHFGPKAHGLMVLEEVLRGRSLDFVLLQSSLAAVLGGLGNVAYAAANVFMDAFAHQQRQSGGTRWISVNWDSWHQPDDPNTAIGTTLVELAMTPQEGLEVVRRVLTIDPAIAQVVISTASLPERLDQWVTRESFGQAEPGAAQQALPGRGELERRITAIWQRVLDVAHVGPDDNFFDLGGNSLSGMQMISELKRELQVQVAPVTLFGAPTVRALTLHLLPEASAQSGEAQPNRAVERMAVTGPIAIVSMAGRFPGAPDVDTFWKNLRDGVETISFFSDSELAEAGIPAELLRDPQYVKARPILEDVESFDAPFFSYTPREAELMDPQQRLFLECAWEALERAGYATQSYPGAIGVYGGASISTYLLGLYANPDFAASIDPLSTIIGNDKDALTTSVSYKLNLKGPSMAVQTFCSTSLVAVHLACQSLRRGECSLALAGGVSIVVPQQSGYHYQGDGIVSPDGHCRTFDAQAQGTLFGNGVGVVVLKRLEDALADGDSVHAVIRGSAVNNDGSFKVGYTAPSVEGQSEVIAAALDDAGIPADTISYIEAHGTGTALGDPIEVAALTRAFRAQTGDKGFCAIGSVKSNIGHLDRAAGVAALIKTVLALKHQQIPPSLHYESPNPQIDFASSPFYVNTKLADWTRNGHPRRAGVSALGFGGTNAHVILEEAPPQEESGEGRAWQVLPLSARTETALQQASANLAAYLRRHPDANLADVAFTLQVGRRTFSQRRFLVCQSHAEAIAALEASHAPLITGRQEHTNRPVVFLFPGQGSQYAQMARDLYQDEPVFREQLDRCAELLRPHLGLDLRDLLYPSDDKLTRRQGDKVIASEESVTVSPGHPVTVSGELEQTQYAQPALFAVEYALAQLWMAWGVQPQAMLGHSIGEYVAACLAGVFSLEDALALVAERGRLMQSLPEGAMLSVALPEAELLPYLSAEVELAAVNGPAQCVVAGPHAAIDALQARLERQEVGCRRLRTSHAFHSAMMEPIVEQFAAAVARVARRAPQLPFVSNVSGSWITAAEATDPHYWARHLRQPVRFAAGLQQVLQDADVVLLETGPGRTLSTLVKDQPDRVPDRVVLASVRHPQHPSSDVGFLLTTLGRLWQAGVAIDWRQVHGDVRRRRVPLPTYPFERQRYWMRATGPLPGAGRRPTQRNTGKKPDLAEWFYLPAWRRTALPNLPEAGQDRRICLVFVGADELGHAVVGQLDRAGHDVITVVMGEQSRQIDDRVYAIDPRRREEYVALLNRLRDQEQLPDTIVHLWSIIPGELAAYGNAGFDAAQERGFYSLLLLAQALGDAQISSAVQLTVVSQHTHSVTPAETVWPEQATILGACKVIPQEYPQVVCRCLDITQPRPGQRQQMARLAGRIVAETLSEAVEDTIVYRGNQRWVQTFEPLRLPEPPEPVAPLRHAGVYLVTGGLAEIGRALTDYLARTAQARLVLIEDADFPPQEDWERWLAAHDEHNSISRKIRSARQLIQHGAEVLVAGIDIADAAQMQAVVDHTLERFGTLHGVIHAATVTGERAFRAIQETNQVECGWHFAAKVHSLFALEQALEDHDLDFCLLVSSLSAFLGGRGYVAYAAANLFMDAFVQQHNRIGCHLWISVNWDAWQLEDGKMTAISQELSQLAMTPDEGGEAFRRIVAWGAADHVITSTADLAARIAQSREQAEELRRIFLPGNGAAASALHPRPQLATPYVAPDNELEHTIATVWQQVLGFEQVGVEDNFFDLGGDSLIAMRVVAQLRAALRMDISVVSLYELLNVKGLAAFVAQGGDTTVDAGQQEERVARVDRRKQYRQMKRAGR